jgi:peroxiredoxin (alkyl hydroperoxide reductase subunit C)
MAIDVGQQAPEFDLKNPAGESVQLSAFSGKPVLLVFYPFTFTGVCEGELCTLRDDFSQFEKADVQVVAVSCDSRHAQRIWTEEQGFPFPVLSDFWPHGEVARAYGVFNEALGCANRASFLIDGEGKVVDTFASADLGTPRTPERYAEALAKL